MALRLPSVLKKSPILNCTCELRYESPMDVEQILPGQLYASLSGTKKLLPVPSVPPEVIRNAPGMQAIPSFCLEWDGYNIAGNYTYVSISLAKAYERWSIFRSGVLEVFSVLQKSGLFESIVRNSMKYINFIEVPQDQNAIDLINVEIRLVNENLRDENIQLRVSKTNDEYTQIVNIASDVAIHPTLETKKGALIDTDILHIFTEPVKQDSFFEYKEKYLDELHTRNRILFFSLLSKQAIDMLEPEYDS